MAAAEAEILVGALRGGMMRDGYCDESGRRERPSL